MILFVQYDHIIFVHKYHKMKRELLILLICLSNVFAATLRETVIEGQLAELMQKIKDKTVVMLTNPTSVDGKMKPLFDRILAQR